jgi:hypothetical protein
LRDSTDQQASALCRESGKLLPDVVESVSHVVHSRLQLFNTSVKGASAH